MLVEAASRKRKRKYQKSKYQPYQKRTFNLIQGNQTASIHRLQNRADIKWFQVATVATTFSSLIPLIISLTNTFVRGTNWNNFLGKLVTPVNMTWRYSIIGGDATNNTRVVIIQYTPQGPPNIGNILLTPANQLSPFNPDFWEDFTVLTDRLYDTTINGPNTVSDKIFIKGKKMLPLQFNAAGNLSANGVYMLVFSDSVVVPNPSIAVYSELRFLDN